MPEYRVKVWCRVREEYLVEADSPEEAFNNLPAMPDHVDHESIEDWEAEVEE